MMVLKGSDVIVPHGQRILHKFQDSLSILVAMPMHGQWSKCNNMLSMHNDRVHKLRWRQSAAPEHRCYTHIGFSIATRDYTPCGAGKGLHGRDTGM